MPGFSIVRIGRYRSSGTFATGCNRAIGWFSQRSFINEIYIGTTNGSIVAASDQFIELYNPQTTVQYLDGDVLTHFGSGGKLKNGALQQPVEAWKFPGVRGGHTLRVQPGEFIVIAATAKAYSNGVDLSNANYECYTGTPILDQDEASAVNLTKVSSGLINSDFSLSTSHDAVGSDGWFGYNSFGRHMSITTPILPTRLE